MSKLCLIPFDIVNRILPPYFPDLFETYQPTTTTGINLMVDVGRDEYIGTCTQQFQSQC